MNNATNYYYAPLSVVRKVAESSSEGENASFIQDAAVTLDRDFFKAYPDSNFLCAAGCRRSRFPELSDEDYVHWLADKVTVRDVMFKKLTSLFKDGKIKQLCDLFLAAPDDLTVFFLVNNVLNLIVTTKYNDVDIRIIDKTGGCISTVDNG